ncbi:hypothetical protein [Calothrix sp. PCC 7507]|uniref:hypothetical protein n=1 Tax=Calothrix sp. PCC 7507 TaxID=99598 RepID=UPI00029F10EA|nr:hypothetical protein [Calothrix sp. PCC 7507]AFY35754.1 hypothetical protein Cal7507_5419 [Calothrix sp. PCC 7507]
MTRQRRKSRVLEKAEFRVAALNVIDPNLNFDDNCNLQNLTQTIQEFRTALDAYNAALTMLDSSKTKVDEMEKILSSLSDKMLTGVGFKYGRNSNEYELAGGVRESERIRKSRLTRLKTTTGQVADKNAQSA